MRTASLISLLFVVCTFGLTLQQANADQLALVVNGRELNLDGDILLEGQDNSLYFLSTDGKLWFVQPEQIKKKVDVEEPAKPKTKKQIGEQLLRELPSGFRIYETDHYVIAYQTELAYAKWVASLYESRLYRAFEQFWERKKRIKLTEPQFPMAVIVFGSRAQYQAHVDRELGPGQNMVAYYNLENNRVTMFDLTAAQRNPNQAMNERKIEQVLQNPAAINMVATMIHEATHQLVFNRGIQTRFADTPLWLNEGMAMYFEAPNLQSKRGWQRPGMIFEQRLVRFRKYLSQRPADSLLTLIANSDRLQTQETALDAYAESWALCHFLVNRRSKEFVEYMKHMSAKKALVEDTPEKRIAEFKQFFGDDLEDFDKDFVSYIRRLR